MRGKSQIFPSKVFPFILILKAKLIQSVLVIGLTTIVLMNGLILDVVPKIERITQGPAAQFMEEKSKEDCYIEVIQMKSYMQYFYGEVKFENRKESKDLAWLLKGDIDKPVYRNASTKIDKEDIDKQRVFGSKFFDTIQSSFMPINEPNLDASYILDFGDVLEVQLVGQKDSIEKYSIR